MQKVQTVDLRFVEDREFFIEQYEMLGFHAIVKGDDLELYWGKKPKRKKEEKREKPEHKPGQEKTARRLGR
jgi:hypothetical protein